MNYASAIEQIVGNCLSTNGVNYLPPEGQAALGMFTLGGFRLAIWVTSTGMELDYLLLYNDSRKYTIADPKIVELFKTARAKAHRRWQDENGTAKEILAILEETLCKSE